MKPIFQKHSNLAFRFFGLLKPYWKELILAGLTALSASAASVLAPIVIMKVLVDGILSSSPDEKSLSYYQYDIALLISRDVGISLFHSGLLLAILWIFIWGVSYYLYRVLTNRIIKNCVSNLRIFLFEKIVFLPSSHHDRASHSSAVLPLTTDIDTLNEAFVGVVTLIGETLPFALAMVIIWQVEVLLLVFLLPALVLFAVSNFNFRKKSRRANNAIRSAKEEFSSSITDKITGIEIVQIYRGYDACAADISKLNATLFDAEEQAVRLETSYMPLVESMPLIATSCIALLGGIEYYYEIITIGSLLLIVQFVDLLFRPLTTLMDRLAVFVQIGPSLQRIFSLIDTGERSILPRNSNVPLMATSGAVTIRNLSFGYESERQVIRNVSLDISAGKRVAIVGSTGAGKSTIAKLLCRIYDIEANSIYIDGIDIMSVDPRDVRNVVGIALQDALLVSGTVLDNIRYGNAGISRTEAMEVMQLAGASALVSRLPSGIDTSLSGPDRVTLSLGEKQLIAFARALARNSKVLVLDEATSNLDGPTEGAIKQAISNPALKRTVIAISHRLRLVRDMDHIFVLEGGSLVESGSHDELIQSRGPYFKLWLAQLEQDPNSGT
ncbi:ABC transporter ATP-binding protein [Rhizobium leguminosarum]|uniref:ABC transporter ATP-binding protein n=1 Tax=Rhizobium leguminosarum TaxID=384 RepID=UPI0004254634|nr:ABC transporter ATP-binding protein [Rhizobium leguminosarum]